MTKNEAEARLDLSRKTLDTWEAMGGPTGSVGGLMRMLSEESNILFAIAEEHPALAAAAGALGKRYGEFVKRFKN